MPLNTVCDALWSFHDHLVGEYFKHHEMISDLEAHGRSEEAQMVSDDVEIILGRTSLIHNLAA